VKGNALPSVNLLVFGRHEVKQSPETGGRKSGSWAVLVLSIEHCAS
jgi:hypothetical protein